MIAIAIALLAGQATVVQAAATQPPPIEAIATGPRFAPMAFLLGHCWQGRFADGKLDTHCFESVYNLRFIRDRHEVTGGYAGESLYAWNDAEARAEYTYWNTAGGISHGSMRERDGVLDFGDEVYRSRSGQETRISTTWHRIGNDSYETRSTSAADPTGSRVVRYTRLDRLPVQIEETRSDDGSTTLSHELVVPARPVDVYHAFASAEGWREWAVPLAWPASGDPDTLETSYATGAAPGDPRNIRQRFVLRVPNRLIVFRTIQTPTGFPHSQAFMQVTQVVELEPVGDDTRVRLSGIGYPAGEAGQALLGFFRDGNRSSLEQLRARFVTGPVDWVARQAAAPAR